jgi:hypothetical protein
MVERRYTHLRDRSKLFHVKWLCCEVACVVRPQPGDCSRCSVTEIASGCNRAQPLALRRSEYPVNDLRRTRNRLRSVQPLGKGFLTGKIDENTTFDSSDFRNTVSRFNSENRKANQKLVDLLQEIAKRKNATPAQIALAWLLAQKPWIVPIPGTTKLHRREENIGAAAIELTTDDLTDIKRAAAQITVHEARYPEQLEKMSNR